VDTGLIVVFITVDSQRAARKIADVLLQEKKAACVNILSGIESHYWWQGKLKTAKELLLIVKTHSVLLDDVTTLIKANHPYQGAEKDFLRSPPPLKKGDKGGLLILKSLSISLYERERKLINPLFHQPAIPSRKSSPCP
jgi:uncharacterized protein involved in tolerance to divalent cations